MKLPTKVWENDIRHLHMYLKSNYVLLFSKHSSFNPIGSYTVSTFELSWASILSILKMQQLMFAEY